MTNHVSLISYLRRLLADYERDDTYAAEHVLGEVEPDLLDTLSGFVRFVEGPLGQEHMYRAQAMMNDTRPHPAGEMER